jgi:hypothetical protein
VRFAETLMEDGCPPVRLPEELTQVMAPASGNALDTDEQSLDVATAELTRAWKTLATGPACTPGR